MNPYGLLADAVVVLHLAYLLFVVFGLAAILLGWLLNWQWVRNFWFRAVHFMMIAVVVAESLLGIVCPLTTWEHNLRAMAGEDVQQGSFVGRLAHDVLFLDASPWMFTVAYCLFGAAVLATLIFIPPRRPGRDGRRNTKRQ